MPISFLDTKPKIEDVIRKVKLPNETDPREISVKYLHNAADTEDWTLENLLEAISTHYEIIVAPADFIKADGTIDTTKYPANADKMNQIWLYEVYEGTGSERKLIGSDEYIVVREGTAPSYTYRWELIGRSGAEFKDYAKVGTRTTSQDGAHTHEVTGKYTNTTYTTTDKYMVAETESTAVVDSVTPTKRGLKQIGIRQAVAADNQAIKVKTSPSKDIAKAAPSATTFYGVKAETKPVAQRNDEITSIIPAKAVDSGARPTRTVLGTPLSASKITKTDKDVDLTYTTETITAIGNADVDPNGSFYELSVDVDNTTGTLTFTKSTTALNSVKVATRNITIIDLDEDVKTTVVDFTDAPVSVPVISSNTDVAVANVDTAVEFYGVKGATVDVAQRDDSQTSIVAAVANGTVTDYTFDSFDVAKVAASDTIVATGDLVLVDAADAGDAVVSDISVTTNVDAVTEVGLADDGTAAEGGIKFVQGISGTANTGDLANGLAKSAGAHTHTVAINHEA